MRIIPATTDDRLKYIDSVETETHVYIATEPVRPLEGVLRDLDTGTGAAASKSKESRAAWMGWGLKSISVSAT